MLGSIVFSFVFIIEYFLVDTLENVDDYNSIVDAILLLRQDHIIFTEELNQRNEHMRIENEKLLANVQEQQSLIHEYLQTKTDLEKLLSDNEQKFINLKSELEEKHHQYQVLNNEYQLYKDEHKTKISKKLNYLKFFSMQYLSYGRFTSSNH